MYFYNMSIIVKLASQLGRRDEAPNQELAAALVISKDKASIKELISFLRHPQKEIMFDSIKVLYEIGYQDPDLIAPYVSDFVLLLQSKHNRMQWGAMTALSAITPIAPDRIFSHLTEIISAAETGTVITKDHYMTILNLLARISKYYESCMSLILEQMHSAAENQFPTYAENAYKTAQNAERITLLNILELRVNEINSTTKKSRVEKLIKKITADRRG